MVLGDDKATKEMRNFMSAKCWCGNQELLPYSEGYNRCDACFTLVNQRDFDESIYNVQNENTDLYGASYWEEHFLKLAKVPSMADLHDMYLSGRCLYWLKYLLKYVLPPASIAEIGCGLGQMPYLSKQAGFTQIGVELSPKICEYSRQIFEVDMLRGSVDDLVGEYDAILFLDLLEHIVDPVSFMSKIAQHSKPKTVLLIQTPCYNPDLTFEEMCNTSPNFKSLLVPEEHIFLFSRQSMQTLLNKSGFIHIQFEPAVFGDDYDMFLAASLSPLTEYSQENIQEALSQYSGGWLVRAIYQVQKQLTEAHQHLTNSQQQLMESRQQTENTQILLTSTQQQFNESQQLLTESQQQVSNTQQQLTESQQQVSNTQQQLTGSQQQVSDIQQQLTGSQHLVNETQEKLIDTQKQLTDTQKQLDWSQQELSDTQMQLAGNQQQLEDTQQQLVWNQQQLTENQQQLAWSQQQLSDSQEQLLEKQQQLAWSQQQESDVKKQLSEKEELLIMSKHELDAIKESRSWKLTKPLRYMGKTVRKVQTVSAND